MKISEFIEKVNEIAYTRQIGRCIQIYSSDMNTSGQWFLIINPHEEDAILDCNWASLDLDPKELRIVLDAIAELKATPVEDRFPEKKYRLLARPNVLETFGSGVPAYVSEINATSEKFVFVLGEPKIYSKSALEGMEKLYPMMKPSIEAMKEEAKDDE